jgi:drug/metabolite transporter (DMT)-like permease
MENDLRVKRLSVCCSESLVGAETASGQRAVVIGSIAILIGTFSWSVGVIYSRTSLLPRNALARAGMPEIVGSLILLTMAGLTGEFSRLHIATVTSRSALSLFYLITFGSIITFSAYTWLLDHVSPTLVSTHTYVNPVIAVLIGWLWAGEVTNLRILEAGLLTLVAVFLISRGTGKAAQEVPEEVEVG